MAFSLRRRPPQRLTPARIFLLLNFWTIFMVWILGFRINAFRPVVKPGELAASNGHYISLIGRVCEEADVDVKSRRLTVCANGRVLVTTNLYPVYNYGDWLKISGRLETPPKIEGFDYENYLARYDIYSVMYYPKIESSSGILSYSQKIYLNLLRFKWRLKEIMERALPEPEAGLADALLLGYNRTVLKSDLQIFSRVGISHIIAISGSHITILSAMIINFFLTLGLSRRRSLIIIFGFLFLYPLVTGLAASAVRSAIMGGLAFLAVYYNRQSSLINALIFSASAMLVFNPRLLRADIGFQLSFVALLGIIYIYPLGETLTKKWLEHKKWGRGTVKIIKTGLETINLTLVSQIVILPVALINFKQLSLIAPLANLLLLWAFPFILGSLIIALFLAALLPALAPLWFGLSYFLLKFIFIVANFLARPTWAAVTINDFNWWWGGAYYGALIILLFISRKFIIDKKARSR